MLVHGISTSALGKNRTIVEVFEHLDSVGYDGPVEIAIGPEPVDNPLEALQPYVGDKVTTRGLTGHAMLPLGMGSVINPYTDFNGIIKACWVFNFRRYSMHAPTKKHLPTWDSFLMWAMKYFTSAHERGVPFSLETLYPDPAGHWLSSWEEVARFLEWTIRFEWQFPLVVDMAHLRICRNAGTWTDDHIHEVLESPFIAQVHYSSNDGKRDIHSVFDPAKDQDIVRWFKSIDRSTLAIDEGRRENFDPNNWQRP